LKIRRLQCLGKLLRRRGRKYVKNLGAETCASEVKKEYKKWHYDAI
jgi:hypothetical protein